MESSSKGRRQHSLIGRGHTSVVFRNVASSVLGPALSVGCLMSEEGEAAVRPSDTILK